NNNALLKSDSHSGYNSLQVSIKERYARGTQLELAYTYSKSIDDSTSRGAAQPGADVANDKPVVGEQLKSRLNRSVSDFDRTHRLVIAGPWEVYIPKTQTAFFRGLVSVW